jgi:hypothetical protein
VNAITGAAPSGCPGPAPTFTTSGGNTVTFTDVTVDAIDAGSLGAISGFDTVLLYEVCDIANHPATMNALNAYLTAGDGKVVIYDADMCAGDRTPNYNNFLFPFATSNPGPIGYRAAPTFIEPETLPAVLTRGLAGIEANTSDAIGDSNTFVANNPAWCVAEQGPNGIGAIGIQIGYARTAAGGLVIYDGNDNFYTTPASAWDVQVFNNILDQPFNPDSLPCGRVATGITVNPGKAVNPAGSSHTVTATVLNSTGAPLAGVTVTFKVTSGPNAGKTGTCVTNAAGQCTFTYNDPPGVTGTDNIAATFIDAAGILHSSNNATKTWGTGCTNATVTVTTTAKVTVFVTQPPTAAVTVFVTQPLPCNGPSCTNQPTITTTATVAGAILVLSLVGVFLGLFVIVLMMIRRKVRCRYCGKWFDERLSRCPRCGAPA